MGSRFHCVAFRRAVLVKQVVGMEDYLCVQGPSTPMAEIIGLNHVKGTRFVPQ